MDWKKTSERLYNLRDKKNLSLQQLSDALVSKYPSYSFSKTSMKNYENPNKVGGMSIEKLMCLAEFYDVSPEYLLGVSDCEKISVDEIIAKMGLTERSIQRLIECSEMISDPFLYGLNYLIENDFPESQNETRTLRLLINYISSGSGGTTKVFVDENGVRIKTYKNPSDFLSASQKYFDVFDAEQIITSLYLNDLNESLIKEKVAYKASAEYSKYIATVADIKDLELQKFMMRYAPHLLSTDDN